jgi:hypothetical protein
VGNVVEMRRLLTLAVFLALVSASCGGSSQETTTSPDAATTTTVTATASTSAPTTTSTPEPTTTTALSAGGPDCLVGTWVLDSEAFVENFDSIFAEAGMPEAEVSPLDGTFTAELTADGSLGAEREDWGFRISMPDGTFIIEINGIETGSWSADDSILTVDTDVSQIEVSASIEVGDQVIAMPEGQFPIEPPEGIATGSSYTCDGDVVTLSNAGVESVLHRA